MDIGLFAFSPVSYANFISCIFLGICPYHQIFKLNVIKLFLISSWDCHTGCKLVDDDPFLNIYVGNFCLNIFPHFFLVGILLLEFHEFCLVFSEEQYFLYYIFLFHCFLLSLLFSFSFLCT